MDKTKLIVLTLDKNLMPKEPVYLPLGSAVMLLCPHKSVAVVARNTDGITKVSRVVIKFKATKKHAKNRKG